MPTRTWVAGETVTAANVNDYLQKQVVTTCTSGTRPASPVEGMCIYETDTDKLLVYDGAAWAELAKPGQWSAYTPTLTQSGAVTATVTYSRYLRQGRLITYQGLLSVTGTGTAANIVTVSLPVTAAQAGHMVVGSGYLYDASVNTTYAGTAALNTTSALGIHAGSGAVNNYLGASGFTAALASGDAFTWAIAYEAAS